MRAVMRVFALTNYSSQFYAIGVVRRNRGRIIFTTVGKRAGLKARQLSSGQTLASTGVLAAKCLKTPANAGVSWLPPMQTDCKYARKPKGQQPKLVSITLNQYGYFCFS
jgi:hypothetical protein